MIVVPGRGLLWWVTRPSWWGLQSRVCRPVGASGRADTRNTDTHSRERISLSAWRHHHYIILCCLTLRHPRGDKQPRCSKNVQIQAQLICPCQKFHWATSRSSCNPARGQFEWGGGWRAENRDQSVISEAYVWCGSHTLKHCGGGSKRGLKSLCEG